MSTKKDVRVNARVISPSVTAIGIGFPLVVATEGDAAYKEYDISVDLSAVLEDYATTDETYKKIAAIKSQVSHVPKVAVIGVAYTLTTVTVVPQETLIDSGDGLTFDFANPNAIEETVKNLNVDAVSFDIEDLASIDYDAASITFGSSQTGAVVIADYDYFATSDTISKVTDKLDELVATTSTNKWYCLLTPFWTKTEVEAIVAFVEAQNTSDNFKYASFTTPQLSLNADITSDLVDLQTHDTILEHVSDALMGYGLSLEPGELTFKDVNLVGISAATYNRTQLNSIDTLKGQTYIEKDDTLVTTEGRTAGTRFIDSIQAQHAVIDRLQKRVQKTFASSTKVPNSPLGETILTNATAQVIEPLVETDTDVGLILRVGSQAQYTISFANTTYDQETRTLSGIEISYVEAGAIHIVQFNLNITLG